MPSRTGLGQKAALVVFLTLALGTCGSQAHAGAEAMPAPTVENPLDIPLDTQTTIEPSGVAGKPMEVQQDVHFDTNNVYRKAGEANGMGWDVKPGGQDSFRKAGGDNGLIGLLRNGNGQSQSN